MKMNGSDPRHNEQDARYEWEGGPRRSISSDRLKSGSKVYLDNQGNLLGSSNDRDVLHEPTGRMRTQEYLR